MNDDRPRTSLLAKLRDWRRRVRDRHPEPALGGKRRRTTEPKSWSEALRFPPF